MKPFQLWILGACAVTLLAFQEDPVVAWVRSHAVVIKTVEAGRGFEDLQPLKQMVGDARIVSLGEATHGTREFFQLKHRLLEFLATQMGFTIFSIEANMPEAYRLNDYVLTGVGDPKALIKGMYFWTWDTEEVLAMIQWMREFNQSGKGRIQFTGFDMQAPEVALEILRQFVAKYDPSYAAALEDASPELGRKRMTNAAFGVVSGTFPVQPALGKTIRFSGYIQTRNVSGGYAGLWWRVDGEPRQILGFDNMANRGVSGTTDWNHYQIEMFVPGNARNINFGAMLTGSGTAWFDSLSVEINGQPFSSDGFDLDFESGTHGFFTAGEGYSVHPDAETFHSGKQSLRMDRIAAPGKPVSTGAFLRDDFGKEMVNFGFAFSEGGFRAVGEGSLKPFTLTPSPSDTLDAELAATKIPVFAIDWRTLPTAGPVAEWFSAPHKTRWIGSVYDPKNSEIYFNNLKIREAFDVTLFVDKTTTARGISRN